MNCIMRKYVLVSFRMKSNRRFHDFLITCGNSSAMQRNKSDWKNLYGESRRKNFFREFSLGFLCISTIKTRFRTDFRFLHRKYIIFLCVSFLKKRDDLAYLINPHKTIDTGCSAWYTKYIKEKHGETNEKKALDAKNDVK